jgi:hypothetical protein
MQGTAEHMARRRHQVTHYQAIGCMAGGLTMLLLAGCYWLGRSGCDFDGREHSAILNHQPGGIMVSGGPSWAFAVMSTLPLAKPFLRAFRSGLAQLEPALYWRENLGLSASVAIWEKSLGTIAHDRCRNIEVSCRSARPLTVEQSDAWFEQVKSVFVEANGGQRFAALPFYQQWIPRIAATALPAVAGALLIAGVVLWRESRRWHRDAETYTQFPMLAFNPRGLVERGRAVAPVVQMGTPTSVPSQPVSPVSQPGRH